MPAATSTVISPIVSMPRMSTRTTLTTFLPPPSGSARADTTASSSGCPERNRANGISAGRAGHGDCAEQSVPNRRASAHRR